MTLFQTRHRMSKARDRTLSYATASRPPPRVSKLAVASPIVAVFASPCLLVPLLSDLLGQDRLLFAAVLVATAVSIAGFIRVRLSRGNRTGLSLCLIGFAITAVWWAILYYL